VYGQSVGERIKISKKPFNKPHKWSNDLNKNLDVENKNEEG
jgi:hypothetical protein